MNHKQYQLDDFERMFLQLTNAFRRSNYDDMSSPLERIEANRELIAKAKDFLNDVAKYNSATFTRIPPG